MFKQCAINTNIIKVFTSIPDISKVVRINFVSGDRLCGADSLSSQQLTKYSGDLPHLFWNLRVQQRLNTGVPLDRIWYQMEPVYIFTFSSFKISLHVILPLVYKSAHRSFKWSSSFKFKN